MRLVLAIYLFIIYFVSLFLITMFAVLRLTTVSLRLSVTIETGLAAFYHTHVPSRTQSQSQ